MVASAPAHVLAIERLRAQRRAHPLSMWRAWDRAEPRTSQRRAIQQLGSEITALFGGNRSGKTEGARAIAVAMALGRDHPAVRIFLRLNGIDPLCIPKGPGKVYLVALTSNDSLSYHRKQVDALLPKEGVKWWNRNYRGEARCEIEVPGYDEKAEIWFKSCDQGRKAMQGASCRCIVFDEEPPRDVFSEARMRLLDQSGRLILSMTPLNGMTWVYDEIASKPNTPERKAHWIHTRDNPWQADAARLEDVFGELDDAEAAARSEGRFVTREGLVFREWSRSTHLVEPFTIPDDWPRYRAIDFGTRNPTAILWGAMSPDDVLYIYREHYEAERTLAHHVRCMLEHDEPIEMTWADPAQAQLLLELVTEHGVPAVKANKHVRKGVERVRRRLRGVTIDGKHHPGVLVFSDLARFLREVEAYIWDPNSSKTKDGQERPKKKDDHLMDCFRYLVMGVDTGQLYSR